MNTKSSLGMLTLLAALASVTHALADTRRECIASNEAAQAMRDERKLVKAREIFLQCTREACPKVIRQDCAESVRALDARIPTVIVQATSASGAELVAVKVSIDGEVVQESLDGKALMIDPGVHWFRFESAGYEATELQVVAVEGERNRKVAISFGAPPASSPSAGQPPAAAASSGPSKAARQPQGSAVPAPPAHKTSPVGAYILGGAGLAAIGAGAYLYFAGLGQRSDAIDNGCGTAGQCDDEKKSIRTKLVIGDVLTGIGVAGLAAGIVWAVKASGKESAPQPPGVQSARRPVLDLHPTSGGTMFTARFVF